VVGHARWSTVFVKMSWFVRREICID